MQLDNRPLQLLVVEDNPGDFVLVEEYINEHFANCILENAKTAASAAEKIEENDQSYDCILLDLTLPDISGEQLIRKILERSGYIPVIVLTGYTNLEFSKKSLSLGISDYLLKDSLSPFLLYKSIIYAIEKSASTHRISESEKN